MGVEKCKGDATYNARLALMKIFLPRFRSP